MLAKWPQNRFSFKEKRLVNYSLGSALKAVGGGLLDIATAIPKAAINAPLGIATKTAGAVYKTVASPFVRLQGSDVLGYPAWNKIGEAPEELIRSATHAKFSPILHATHSTLPTFIGDIRSGVQRAVKGLSTGVDEGSQVHLMDGITSTIGETRESVDAMKKGPQKNNLDWHRLPVLGAITGIPGGLKEFFLDTPAQAFVSSTYGTYLKGKETVKAFSKDAFSDWNKWDALTLGLRRVGKIGKGFWNQFKDMWQNPDSSTLLHIPRTVVPELVGNAALSAWRIASSPIFGDPGENINIGDATRKMEATIASGAKKVGAKAKGAWQKGAAAASRAASVPPVAAAA